MKHLDEYRDKDRVASLVRALHAETRRPWVIMEVCGGQTHAIVRYGLDTLLPPSITLLHGPGCPVCVTPTEQIDRAHAIASEPGVIFCSFGDMLRVPGTHGDLLRLKAAGRDVRVVYSPLDAVAIAERAPDRRVVFFAIGFETTAPANAMAVQVARARGITNFSILTAHVLVPPVLAALLEADDNRVQGFLGPGHVATIVGARDYEPIAARYRVPIAVTGFEPVDLLAGLLACVRQLERGEARVEIPYARAVTFDGNPAARASVREVFEVADQTWRGLGRIPQSGLRVRAELAAHDAERVFDVARTVTHEPAACIAGKVLRGVAKPTDCAAFGNRCTPQTPLGATMVSSEGACAAYLTYGRTRTNQRALPLLDEVHGG